MRYYVGLLFFLFCSPLFAWGQNQFYSDAALDEVRLEVSDLKHALHTARIEMNLLEEKLTKQERVVSSIKSACPGQGGKTASSSVEALDRRVVHLEKLLEKTMMDLRSLSTAAQQALNKLQELEQTITSQDKRFDEIVSLKGTLSSISKAMGHSSKSPPAANHTTYRVKQGDSLEKIARAHNTTVTQIKQLNSLTQDKIVIGQELSLPGE